MRRLWKWVGITLGGLLVVVILVAVVLYVRGGSRIQRIHEVDVVRVPIPTDSAAIARGRHLAHAVTLCTACHGETLAGDTLVDDPVIVRLYASNLTSGQGGTGALYQDVDYVRAIRHGVNRDGRGLMIMHSDAYNKLSAEDLGAIIAYVKSVAPVDNEVPGTRPGPLGRIFVALGFLDEAMPLIPAEVIDHSAPFTEAPPAGPTAEYGRYMISIALCSMCHGANFTGGPPIEEGAPAAPNLAVYTLPEGWSEDDFIRTMRTGVNPAGRAIDPEAMPWEIYSEMTDDELLAVWRAIGEIR